MKLELRGIGPLVVSLYLRELGGRDIKPGWLEGNGWQAHVHQGQPVYVGSIRLGVTEVEFSGDEEAVERVRAAFEKKVIRAGG